MKKILILSLLFVSGWAVAQNLSQAEELYMEQLYIRDEMLMEEKMYIEQISEREGVLKEMLYNRALVAMENSIGSNGNTALHDAVLADDLEKAERLLQREDTSVNMTNELGDTALDLAREKEDLIRVLYSPKATVGVRNSIMMDLLIQHGGEFSADLEITNEVE